MHKNKATTPYKQYKQLRNLTSKSVFEADEKNLFDLYR